MDFKFPPSDRIICARIFVLLGMVVAAAAMIAQGQYVLGVFWALIAAQRVSPSDIALPAAVADRFDRLLLAGVMGVVAVDLGRNLRLDPLSLDTVTGIAFLVTFLSALFTYADEDTI